MQYKSIHIPSGKGERQYEPETFNFQKYSKLTVAILKVVAALLFLSGG
jgi:hypothetical protein